MQKEVEDYRTFLSNFKTQKCTTPYLHDLNSCYYYHDQRDHRKKPYSKKNQILYRPDFCTNSQPHDISQCNSSHNYYEYHYHPLIFKRDLCQFSRECQKIYCSFRHYKEDLRNQFFRFDFNTFKVYQCTKGYNHNKKTCLFYHSLSDRRRCNFEEYQHVQCKNGEKCTEQHCELSHNKIQQLFHPKRYKTKFCQSTLNGKQCNYRNFCSFAHNNQQITIELLDEMPKNTQFYLFYFKTVWCPYTNDHHDKEKCVYAHNIQDYRRNPKNFSYLPDKCKNWKKNQNIKSLDEAGCPEGMQCKYCHGWKEYDYHPIIYEKKKNIMMGSNGYLQPKRKGSQMFKQEQIVNKKLVLEDDGDIKNNKLQQIIYDKLQGSNQRNNAFFNGMPFFKATDNSSYCSKTTKAKSQRFSNSENDKLSQMEERGSEKNMSQNCEKTDVAIFDNDQYNEHCEIFKLKQNEKNTLKQRVVSRSCGKKQQQQIQYSQQVYEFTGLAIAEKLRKAKINEIKILNLTERQIQQLKCLSPRDKAILIQNLKDSTIKHKQITQYSKTLKKVFIRFNHELLLKKMSMKKVKENKMIKLQNKQIEDLSFLTEEQKNDLPLIIHFANSEIQFEEINREISMAVKKQADHQ